MATREYDYDLPGDCGDDVADYVSYNVVHMRDGRPWVPEDVCCMPVDVEAAIIALCGRAVELGDDGTTGWLLPCHEVAP